MPARSIILVFVKAPVSGQVKSRLAGAIGDEAALELYKCFGLDIIDAVKKTGYPFRICFHPPEAEQSVVAWLGTNCGLDPQRGHDLGERMEHAFSRIFAEGFERAVLVGSDIPDIPSSVFHEAISSLGAHDLVIGPALDGGYYLIGFGKQAFLPRLFHGPSWGSRTVFRETMSIARSSGLASYRLRQWRDIDTIADLKDLGERSGRTGFDKSRSMTYLRKTGLMPAPAAGNHESGTPC